MQKPKNLDLNLIPFIKINSKEIIYLLIKCKAIKLFKENIKSLSPGLRQRFLDMTLKKENDKLSQN